jgi:hypothetical protein
MPQQELAKSLPSPDAYPTPLDGGILVPYGNSIVDQTLNADLDLSAASGILERRNLDLNGHNIIAPTTGYGPLIIRCSGTLTISGAINAVGKGEVYNTTNAAWLGNGADHDVTGLTIGTGPMLGPGQISTFISPKWPTFTACGGSGGGGASSAGGGCNPGDVGNSGTTKPVRGLASNTLSGGTMGANNGTNGDAVYASGFSADSFTDGDWVMCIGGGGGYGGKSALSYYARGGNGGGLIIICARNIVITAAGSINANGAAGESGLDGATRNADAGNFAGLGGGGGGAGGGIYLTCDTYLNAGANNVTAAGGAAGAAGSGTAGAGGAGGTGVVKIRSIA